MGETRLEPVPPPPPPLSPRPSFPSPPPPPSLPTPTLPPSLCLPPPPSLAPSPPPSPPWVETHTHRSALGRSRHCRPMSAFRRIYHPPPPHRLHLDTIRHFFGLLRQIGVNRRDDLRTVADRGGNTFDRAGAHVADREHAAPAGFERQAVVADLFAGPQEAPFVELQPGCRQPIGIGLGADEREEELAGWRALGARARSRQSPLRARRRSLRARRSRSRSPRRHWAGPGSGRPDIATWSG